MTLALLIYLVYSNLLGVSKKWVAAGSIPPWLASWWVHAIVVLIILGLFWQRGYFVKRKAVQS